MEILELCFGLSFWIERAQMDTELGNEFRVVREPWDVISGGQERFEPIQRGAFEVGQGIGNLGTIISKCVGSVPEIKEALSQEGLQFLPNGLGSQTRAKIGVLLVLSSPSANRLKARVSLGWSLDIMTEVLRESPIAVTGSPSVSAGVLPVSAEFWVWQGGINSRWLVQIYC